MIPALALYLDECVDYRLASHLRRQGIDVLTVQEAHTQSDDDESQLIYATKAGPVLLSHNQIHFRRLHRSFQQMDRIHGGIIIVPQTVPLIRLETRVDLLLSWVSTFPDTESRLFAWSDLQQKLIQGHRLTGWSEENVRDALGWS